MPRELDFRPVRWLKEFNNVVPHRFQKDQGHENETFAFFPQFLSNLRENRIPTVCSKYKSIAFDGAPITLGAAALCVMDGCVGWVRWAPPWYLG
jgi:hypothetical protein